MSALSSSVYPERMREGSSTRSSYPNLTRDDPYEALATLFPMGDRSNSKDKDEQNLPPSPVKLDLAGALFASATPEERIHLLEDQVRKTNAILRRVLRSGNPLPSTFYSNNLDPMDSESIVSSPLAPWNVNSRYMSPLLAAYESSIEELTRRGDDLSAANFSFEQKIRELVSENEELRKHLGEAKKREFDLLQTQKNQRQRTSTLSSSSSSYDDQHERIDLLEEEISLMQEKERELRREIESFQEREKSALHDDMKNRIKVDNFRREMDMLQAEIDVHRRENRTLVQNIEGYKIQIVKMQKLIQQRDMEDQQQNIQFQTMENAVVEKESVLSEYRKELEESRKRTASLSAELSGKNSEVEVLRSTRFQMQKHIDSLSQRVASMEEEKSQLISQVGLLERKELDALKQLRQRMQEIDDMQTTLDSEQKRREAMKSEIQSLQAKIAQLIAENQSRYTSQAEDLKRKLETDLLRAQTDRDEHARARARLEAQIERIQRDKEDLEKNVKKISESSSADVSIPHREFEKWRARIHSAEKDRDDARSEIDSLREWNRKLKGELERSESESSSKHQRLSQQLSAVRIELNDVRESNKQLREELRDSRSACQSLEVERNDIRDALTIENRLRLEELDRKTREFEVERERLRHDVSQYDDELVRVRNEKQQLQEIQLLERDRYESLVRKLKESHDVEIQKLKSEIRELRDSLSVSHSKENTLAIEIQGLRQKNNRLETSIRSLDSQLHESKLQVAELMEKLQAINDEKLKIASQLDHLDVENRRLRRDVEEASDEKSIVLRSKDFNSVSSIRSVGFPISKARNSSSEYPLMHYTEGVNTIRIPYESPTRVLSLYSQARLKENQRSSMAETEKLTSSSIVPVKSVTFDATKKKKLMRKLKSELARSRREKNVRSRGGYQDPTDENAFAQGDSTDQENQNT